MAAFTPGDRFQVTHPQRAFAWMWAPILVLFVCWTPFVWAWGNITSRSIGSAIFFFGCFAVFDVVAFFAWRSAARNMVDPAKNYVELGADALTITLSGNWTLPLRYRDIKAASFIEPSRSLPLVPHALRPLPAVALKLRRFNLRAMFSGMATGVSGREVKVVLVDRQRFIDALTPLIESAAYQRR